MARAYFYNYRTKAIFDEFSTHFSGFLKTGHLISIGEIKHLFHHLLQQPAKMHFYYKPPSYFST